MSRPQPAKTRAKATTQAEASTKADTAAAANPSAHPPIILVHGFRGAPSGLAAIADDLRAAGYEVHVPAVPPFAGAALLEAYTPDAYADFLADYVHAHRLQRPILIGHSMGSLVVAAAASRRPELFDQRLVLLSPISQVTARPFQLIAPLSARLPRRLIDYFTTRFLFVPHDRALFRQVLAETAVCSGATSAPRADIAAAARFSAHHAIADFPLTGNILLLAGAHDRLISASATRALARTLTRASARTVFLAGTGHLHNYEQPHQTAAAILDFLAHA